LNLVNTPSAWNSVHRPVRFTFDFYSSPLFFTYDVSGKAQFAWNGLLMTVPVVGGFVYIDSGEYKGLHKVTGVTNNQVVVTDTDYTIGQTGASGANVYIIQIPTFKFYVGYRSTEAYPNELPETLVASFVPERNTANQIVVDVSGYLRSQFTIDRPVRNGVDWSLFNQFRIVMVYGVAQILSTFKGVVTTPPYMAINSAIKTEELNRKINANEYLHDMSSPALFSCGNTLLTKVIGDRVENVTYTGSVPDNGDFNNDFNADFE